jgi:hypothetical protein
MDTNFLFDSKFGDHFFRVKIRAQIYQTLDRVTQGEIYQFEFDFLKFGIDFIVFYYFSYIMVYVLGRARIDNNTGTRWQSIQVILNIDFI